MHEQSPTKQCFKCNAVKHLGEFYTHPGMSGGHLNKCKECTKSDTRRHRATSDRPRQYDKERYIKNDDRKKKIADGVKRRNKAEPHKCKARYSLTNAVRDGRVKKPCHCSKCGEKHHRIEGHHPDYSKPFDVIWMCPLCHRRHEFAKPF